KFDPVRMLRALQEYEGTNVAAAATHYRMLKSSGRTADYHYVVRKLSFTGEPMDSATRAFVETTFGTPVCSMYGTTEVGVILADYPGAPTMSSSRARSASRCREAASRCRARTAGPARRTRSGGSR